MVLPKIFFWNHAFIRHSFPSSIIGSLICDGRQWLLDLHPSAMLFFQNTCDFFDISFVWFACIKSKTGRPAIRSSSPTKVLKVTVVERPIIRLITGRSTTVTFSTFVGDELRMAGRPDLFCSAEKNSWNMRINRKATIRPQKGLLAVAQNKTQPFLCFETSRSFTTRKIGVPAQGWKIS